MTESPRRDGPGPTQPPGGGYPGYTDPAYAGQAPYGPTYQAPSLPAPTERLPAYSPYGYDTYATGQYGQYNGPHPPGEQPPPPPKDPKSPMWLWILAGGGCADRRRIGHRAGHRQQLESADSARAGAVDAGAELDDQPDDHLPRAHDSGAAASDAAEHTVDH